MYRFSRRLVRSVSATALALALVAGCAGSDEPRRATTRECERLRDHLVDLRVAGTQVDVEAHRAAIRGALGTAFLEQCTKELTDKQVSCAVRATDSEHVSECTRAPTNTATAQVEK